LLIEGKNKEHVSIKLKNGSLQIRMDIKKMFSGFNTIVALFHSSPIEEIDANQGSFISCQDVLFQPSITLKAQEGAEIETILDVQKVTTKITSGGIINIKGSAVTQNHKVSAGGVLEASTLESEQVVVKVAAGGRASVKSSELAEAKVSFGGSVVIHGKPVKIEKRISVGGRIEQKE
jgi:ribosomal 50S subunit-recycling heat shock protein